MKLELPRKLGNQTLPKDREVDIFHVKLFQSNTPLVKFCPHNSKDLFIHRDNICHIVKAPANVPWKIMKLATDVAARAVSSLEGAGVFAVELFLTADGQVIRLTFGATFDIDLVLCFYLLQLNCSIYIHFHQPRFC